MFVVKALDDLAEGALSDDLDQLEPVSDVVSFLDPVVPFFVVESVIHKSLELRRFDLTGVLGQVVKLVVLVDLCALKIC